MNNQKKHSICKIVASLFAVFLFSLVLNAGETTEGESSIIRTQDGVMIIYNSGEISDSIKHSNFVEYNPVTSFRFEIKCKNFTEVERDNLMFLADNIVFQFIPVPISSFSKDDFSKNKNDSLILLYHQFNELKFTRESIPGDYEINDEIFTTSNGKVCMMWEFEMPRTNKDTAENSVYRQMYVTSRIKEKVLMLSSAIQRKNDPKEVKQFLKQTISTIRTTDGIYNLEAIRDSLSNIDK